MEVIKNKRVLAIIGLCGLLLGCFLPYFKISIFGITQTFSLWGYWEGKVIFFLIWVNTLFIFGDLIKKYVPQLSNNNLGKIVEKINNPKLALIPTILVAGFALYLFGNVGVGNEYLKYGIGFWVLWLGIISLIGHSIFYKHQKAPIQYQTQGTINYAQQPMQQPFVAPGTVNNNQQFANQTQPMYNNSVQQPMGFDAMQPTMMNQPMQQPVAMTTPVDNNQQFVNQSQPMNNPVQQSMGFDAMQQMPQNNNNNNL